jgi:TatD DNase family protein
MIPVFYDTHAHLDYPDFVDDIAGVIERAAAAGITRTISIGTNLESSQQALKLCERFTTVFAAVGWHPCEAMQAPSDLRPELRRIAAHPKVVAIGETGLDYRHAPDEKPESSAQHNEDYRAKQQEIFRQQLEVAAELGLNCVIHQRDAMDDVLAAMRPFVGQVRGVFHCFVNNPTDLRRVLDSGSLVSFTGIVTFKNAESVRETVAATPLDRLMLETDSPYLAPVPYRGKRCEPARVREIAEVIAGVKGVSLEQLSRATCANAGSFFRSLAGPKP